MKLHTSQYWTSLSQQSAISVFQLKIIQSLFSIKCKRTSWQLNFVFWSLEIQNLYRIFHVDPKGFWWWCITLRITGFLDFAVIDHYEMINRLTYMTADLIVCRVPSKSGSVHNLALCHKDNLVRGLVGPRASLHVAVKKNTVYCCPCCNLNYGRPTIDSQVTNHFLSNPWHWASYTVITLTRLHCISPYNWIVFLKQ
jgi:hypothetical protein